MLRVITQNIWVRKLALVLVDIGLLVLAAYLSMLLRFDGMVAPHNWTAMVSGLPLIVVCYLACFWGGGLYNIIWRYAGVRDMARFAVSVVVGMALTLASNHVLDMNIYRGVLVLIGMCAMLLVGGMRFIWRGLTRDVVLRPEVKRVPMMIVGAGEAGAYVITSSEKNPKERGKPVLFVDDDPHKRGMRLHNIPVKGPIKEIPALVKRYSIEEIIVAMPSVAGKRIDEIIALCTQTNCHVRIVSDPSELGSPTAQPTIRELNAADFLPRDEIELDSGRISGYLEGRIVLVTGGGGSIGSEICRQVLRYKPEKLIAFDIYENNVYDLQAELHQQYGYDCPIEIIIGSIRDKARLEVVFEKYRPQVVFHAAAHKHVPLMEGNPGEAIKNNVLGTKNLLETAEAFGVERLVQLSTDKAVNPTNVMGATKRITELLVQAHAQKGTMKCMAVRFGNVLGSHGSVIPLLESQIKSGGPVTVTHPDITRYFMTIPEAVQLVLQAGGLATNGAIYVLDMGKPVKILELAERLIRFYGYEPNETMQIDITGLRPGEKLHEELLMASEQEGMRRTAHNKIFVASTSDVDEAELYRQIDELAQALPLGDVAVIAKLSEVVDTYHPQEPEPEKKEALPMEETPDVQQVYACPNLEKVSFSSKK